uniref:Uncharacterized protein n=1 Tax=Kalanchoe fedtschenkoi TaxID=63787 RepID=A0A7N0ZUB5_KALFE
MLKKMSLERTQGGGGSGGATPVVSIECLKGSSKGDEWATDMLQTGDILEEIKIGALRVVGSPYKNGKAGVQKLLHESFKNKETSIRVRVRRSAEQMIELQACIVPNEAAGRRQYMLRAIGDPNYAVGFADRTEAECAALQASRSSRIVNALTRAKLQDGYVAYPWEKRMQDVLAVPNSSSFFSILFLPKAADKAASRYNDIEDTLARAQAWFNAAQASGVSVVLMNIQTESLLTKVSGETASSTVNAGSLSDLSNVANVSLYGFEDYHGVDIGVVRAVRLWYMALGGEYPVEIRLNEGDTKLGFAISRTEEGFIYILNVSGDEEGTPSNRSGLTRLYLEAKASSKMLVVSRVCNHKVLPWMVSSSGAIRCFDTVSLSQKLSLHRHAKVPILLHVFTVDAAALSASPSFPTTTRSFGSDITRPRVNLVTSPPAVLAMPAEVQLAIQPNDSQVQPLPPEAMVGNDEDGSSSSGGQQQPPLLRDTAGEMSFRFHESSVFGSWV